MNPLITPQELNDIIGTVKMVDASFGVPNAAAAMARARIGNAVYFDIDAIADHDAAYPHTLPGANDFAAGVGALGISSDDHVVIYDQNGVSFAAARVWWMFRTFGHEKVQVLNGGLPAWMRAGFATQSGPVPAPAPIAYEAVYRPELFRDYDAVETASETGKEMILDARNEPRFSAMVHSADGDAIAAHIPGSHSQPMTSLLDAFGAMRPLPELHNALDGYLSERKNIIATCGSGVTACVLALGFAAIGQQDVAVYDGSWTEWSDRNGLR